MRGPPEVEVLAGVAPGAELSTKATFNPATRAINVKTSLTGASRREIRGTLSALPKFTVSGLIVNVPTEISPDGAGIGLL